MSSRRATHPVNLEVIIHSQQLEAEAGAARCWLVTLRTRLGGEAAALGQLATACDVTGQRPDELAPRAARLLLRRRALGRESKAAGVVRRVSARLMW